MSVIPPLTNIEGIIIILAMIIITYAVIQQLKEKSYKVLTSHPAREYVKFDIDELSYN